MLPEEKTVGNPWVFFLVRTAMNSYTCSNNHTVAVHGSEPWARRARVLERFHV